MAFILLSSLAFISSDIYITSLPLIKKYFHTTGFLAQYTLTVYFIGLAVTQIVYALLADRYGTNRLISIGLAIYIVSCFFCYSAQTIEQLIIARFVQSIGACSGLVLGRTVITTIYSKNQSAKVFTLVYPFVGISPALVPIFGGAITDFIGWRANFLVLALLGIITLLMYMLYIPKIRNKSNNKHTLLSQIASCCRTLTNQIFCLSVGFICLADAAYFSYVLKAPFIFHDYGYTIKTMSLFFIPTAVSYFIGNYVCRKILSKHTIMYALNVGMIIFAGETIFFFLVKTLLHVDGAWIYLVSLSILTFSNGFIIPPGTAISLNANSSFKNIASGFLGFLQFSAISIDMLIGNNLSYIYLPVLLVLMGIIMVCVGYFLNKKCLKYP